MKLHAVRLSVNQNQQSFQHASVHGIVTSGFYSPQIWNRNRALLFGLKFPPTFGLKYPPGLPLLGFFPLYTEEGVLLKM